MQPSALSIANYFVCKAQQDQQDLRPLKLMKLVYIAHGYMLALLNKTALNPRFDRVEAWKYGPVIPSVYHSFKFYGNNSITEPTKIFTDERLVDGNMVATIEMPTLKDADFTKVCDFVWKNYSQYTASGLVNVLHGEGTPWGMTYVEGKNAVIPDALTKAYYISLVNMWRRNANG